MNLIDKDAAIAEIEKRWRSLANKNVKANGKYNIEIYTLLSIKTFLDTLEVIDPYEQCVQYDSIKAGIQAHAEIYSFNIQSELFNQLTEEQKKLWRKEIEQACISGGKAGVELSNDIRYKIEKQREKKPAWSEENSCYYDDICEILINLINSPKSNVNKDVVQKDLDWLISIRSQQKQEWSKEDKGNLLDVKCIIDEVWHNQHVREEINRSGEELESLWHWLDNIWQRVEYPKSLLKKPAWSEEDEKNSW